MVVTNDVTNHKMLSRTTPAGVTLRVSQLSGQGLSSHLLDVLLQMVLEAQNDLCRVNGPA
jgi:hypothetical protein